MSSSYTQTTPTTKPKHFSKAEALLYATAHARLTPRKMLRFQYIPNQAQYRCVDRRDHRIDHELPEIAIPGAGLRHTFSAFAMINHFEQLAERQFKIRGEELTDLLEKHFGIPSHHTDEKSVSEGHSLACHGCGYCRNTLAGKGISEGAKQYLIEKYIPGLQSRGAKTVVYRESPPASAVLINKHLDFGIAPNPDSINSGPCVYTYDHGWDKRLIWQTAELVYLELLLPHGRLRDITPGEIAAKILWPKAKEQLVATLEDLAPDLPQYFVTRDASGKIIVKLPGENPRY